MEQAEENRFYAQFPLWVLVDQGDPAVDGPATGFVGGEAGGTIFVAVFTDTDLARRFRQANDLGAAAMRRIRDPEHFLDLIGRFPGQVTHLAFDPGEPGTAARFLVPVGKIRETLGTGPR